MNTSTEILCLGGSLNGKKHKDDCTKISTDNGETYYRAYVANNGIRRGPYFVESTIGDERAHALLQEIIK